MPVVFRITYERLSELRVDAQQATRGGLLVKIAETAGLALDTPATLELVLPDGAMRTASVKVLQVLGAHGVAVTIDRALADELQQRSGGTDRAGAGPARHERIDRPDARTSPATMPPARTTTSTVPPVQQRTATATVPPAPLAEERPASGSQPVDKLTQAEKIQLALHGNREQRNAILRDGNRALHPFVLKNPQIGIDDILAIAKNAQSAPEMLKLISARKEWLQNAQVAQALARNPKTPQDVAVRALDFCPTETLRQLAKGGALPAVVQAARKKVIK